MHPIERLRFLARAGSLPAGVLVQEAAGALASFADEPQGFLTACQRVIARQPGSAPLVWLVARAVSAMDPYDELWVAAAEMADDPSGRLLADEVPEAARAVVVGGHDPDSVLGAALRRRPDLELLRVEQPQAADGDHDDSGDHGYGLGGARGGGYGSLGGPGGGRGGGSGGRRRGRGGALSDARPLRTAWWEDDELAGWEPDEGPGDDHLPAVGLAAAVGSAGVVLIEAEAIGPDHALVPLGGATAAACGKAHGVSVWLVGGVGRHLGPRMFGGVTAPFARTDPWNGTWERVGLELVDRVAGPSGVEPIERARGRTDCPECPELFRGVVM